MPAGDLLVNFIGRDQLTPDARSAARALQMLDDQAGDAGDELKRMGDAADDAGEELTKMGKSSDGAGFSLDKLGGQVKGLLPVLGAGVVVDFALDLSRTAREAQLLGEAINVSSGFVLAATQAYKQVGLDITDVRGDLAALRVAQGDVVLGADRQIEAFRTLGFSIDEVKDADAETLFRELEAVAIDSSKEFEALSAILGEDAAANFAKLNGISDDFTDDQVENAALVGETWATVWTNFESQALQALGSVIGQTNRLIDRLNQIQLPGGAGGLFDNILRVSRLDFLLDGAGSDEYQYSGSPNANLPALSGGFNRQTGRITPGGAATGTGSNATADFVQSFIDDFDVLRREDYTTATDIIADSMALSLSNQLRGIGQFASDDDEDRSSSIGSGIDEQARLDARSSAALLQLGIEEQTAIFQDALASGDFEGARAASAEIGFSELIRAAGLETEGEQQLAGFRAIEAFEDREDAVVAAITSSLEPTAQEIAEGLADAAARDTLAISQQTDAFTSALAKGDFAAAEAANDALLETRLQHAETLATEGEQLLAVYQATQAFETGQDKVTAAIEAAEEQAAQDAERQRALLNDLARGILDTDQFIASQARQYVDQFGTEAQQQVFADADASALTTSVIRGIEGFVQVRLGQISGEEYAALGEELQNLPTNFLIPAAQSLFGEIANLISPTGTLGTVSFPDPQPVSVPVDVTVEVSVDEFELNNLIDTRVTTQLNRGAYQEPVMIVTGSG